MKDIIQELQTNGEQHKGTPLGSMLQWAILHIQAQDNAIKGSHELARFVTEVCTGLDMDSIEGRSRFISIVQPQWERLPKSAFKSQLLGEIAALAELSEPELMTLWGASSHIGFRGIYLRKKNMKPEMLKPNKVKK